MIENSKTKIGGLLLAAGGSSRLGRPKQLLKFEGETLIRRSAQALADSACNVVVIVLGAETNRSAAEIADLPVEICINEAWQTGMSSSIVAGLKHLIAKHPDLDAVVITLGDQPHVTAKMIDGLVSEFARTSAAIVASEYDSTVGVPALFSSPLFDELLRLEGDKGARNLIRDNAADVVTLSMDEAAIDIDTDDDAAGLD